MVQLYIYINDEPKRIELFGDEKISVTSSVQNYIDIGKLFTDYSQSFTIPASNTNNAIFSHWYDNAVDDGYNAKTRQNAYIEVDTIPFREGKIQLEKANKKNGYTESYTITFYGNLTQLKDRFKEDRLKDLDFSSYNHEYTATQVINRISSFTPYDIMYPLICSDRRFEYLTGTSNDITTTTGAIDWFELFPAIPLNSVLDLIETKYGVSFTGSFRDYNQFKKLWLYLKNSESFVPKTEQLKVVYDTFDSDMIDNGQINTTTMEATPTWDSPTGNWMLRVRIQIVTTATTPYDLIVKNNGVVTNVFQQIVGSNNFEIKSSSGISQADKDSKYTFYVQSNAPMSFTSVLKYNGYNGYTTPIQVLYRQCTGSTQTTTTNLELSNFVPDIKIADFFMGIVNAFNLIVTPIDNTTFKLQPLELYYNEGQVKDVTKYISTEDTDIEKPKLYKTLSFKYEQSDNILNNAFRGFFNREYGDLFFENTNSSDTTKYEIKLPFENVMFEKATDYDFLTATLVNKDQNAYTPKPMLIYDNGQQSLPTAIKVYNGSTYTNVSTYERFSNEIALAGSDTNYLYSMNFGEEISPFYLVNISKGLYKRHYENYIDNLYNQKTRVVKCKGLLQPYELTNLKLNDRVLIRDNRYIINTFTTDITTGEVSFDLINDYRSFSAATSVGYKYANVEMLSLDNTNQDIEILIYKGMYKSFSVSASRSGFATWDDIVDATDDTFHILTIDANSTGSERSKLLNIYFDDYDGNTTTIQIPILQNA